MAALIMNKVQMGLKVVVVNIPGYGSTKLELLEDIATVVGAKVVQPELGHTIAEAILGKAVKVIVNKNDTIIVDGYGKKEDIDARIDQLRNQMELCKVDREKNPLKARLATMVGGVAILYIGAATEMEMKEKQDRIDDALHATKAAIDEGVVAGGGIAYINAALAIKKELTDNIQNYDTKIITGMKIFMNSLYEPFRAIVTNAGLSPEVILDKISSQHVFKGDVGYDAKNNKYGDMFTMGVIDPAKVARVVIETASSIASTILTTECVIVPDLDYDSKK